MPTPTDLVTDLPADFEVFGQAVDTSLADLKGGTTGQILSKATNTDMDFVWIANDQGDITAVNVTSPITGGGTSGAVTVGIQSASTSQSGAVQLSDSTSTTSSVLASTPTATKAAYDLANTANTTANTANSTANAAIPKSTVTAKGSIVAASASSTPAQLAVGNNGEALLADSTTSTGLRYNPSITAGKNALINGAFDIWQRGTSFTNPAGVGAYNADRWCSYFNNNGTITQETTVKPDTSTYSLKITATATSSSNDLYQLIEQLQMEQFRGKVVTLSVKVAGTATLAPTLKIAYSTTANDSLFNTSTDITPTVVANPAINPSTFVTYISQFTIPTTAKTLRIGLWSNAVVNTNVIYWAEAQLEIGSTATNFSRAGATFPGELAACQRYYYRQTAFSAYGPMLQGFETGSTSANGYFNLPVTLRSTPSAVDYSTLFVNDQSGNITVTGITIGNSSQNLVNLSISAASGMVAGRPFQLLANNSTSAYLGVSAEL